MIKWISVKDRLPEKSGQYLVSVLDDKPCADRLMVVNWSAEHKQWNAFDNLPHGSDEYAIIWEESVKYWAEV